MRDCLADESAEQREARLQQMRDHLADESAKQREARLQQMRDRLAAESAEQREARLQLVSRGPDVRGGRERLVTIVDFPCAIAECCDYQSDCSSHVTI